jgi:hypothetical protein
MEERRSNLLILWLRLSRAFLMLIAAEASSWLSAVFISDGLFNSLMIFIFSSGLWLLACR